MTAAERRIALLMPPGRRDAVFTPRVRERMERLAQVVVPEGSTDELAAALPDVLPTIDACITCWGAPPLGDALLDRAPRLKMIAHAAGTIRHVIPLGAFDRGIAVSHSADVIAEAVCEYVILVMLTGLRRLHLFDAALKAGRTWADAVAISPGHRLAGKTVGLIGCGYVARRVVALLRPFGVRILVYDPYLPEEYATRLRVIPTELDQLMAESDIVSNHAPITPETHHLVGPRQLGRLKDGALLINSARAWSIEQESLLAELRTGRIWAALDVFDEEPLPVHSPFRTLPNVVLTPHRAGHTVETLERQGLVAVEEVARFFAGEPLQHQVARESYAIMG
jgi:phosphoglycerate dehydrogenase-like enzyme